MPPPGAPPLYGEQPAAGPSRPGPRAGAPRALLLVAIVVGLALAGLLALSLRDSAPGGSPLSPIAAAAQKTGALDGARFSGTGEFSGGGVEMTMRFRGVYNVKADRSRIRMETQIPAAPQVAQILNPFVAIQDGLTIYMSAPAFAGELPFGKEWLRLDLPELEGAEAAPLEVESMDPRQILAELELVSDDARRVGRERIGGVVTTHYNAALDPQLLAEQAREAGDDLGAEVLEKEQRASIVDVWVDRRGLVRRTAMAIPFELLGGPGAAMTMTTDFHDFGVEPEIHVPPEPSAFDGTELGREALEDTLAEL